MIPHLADDTRTDEEKEAQRAAVRAANEAACAAALDDLAWWLDHYGYQDDDKVSPEFMSDLSMLFRQGAWLAPRAKFVAVYFGGQREVTAGQLREAMK